MPRDIHIAIGDLHGHYPALQKLLDALDQSYHIFVPGQNQQLREGVHFTFLGDYVDRGAQSLHILRTVMALQQANPTQVDCLMGNHELLALSCSGDDLIDVIEHFKQRPETLVKVYQKCIHGDNGGLPFVANFEQDTIIDTFYSFHQHLHPNHPIGHWLRHLLPGKKQSVFGQTILFSHACLPMGTGISVEDYLAKVQTYLRDPHTKDEAFTDHVFVGKTSIFWNRKLVGASARDAQAALDCAQVDYMVMGHTAQRSGQVAVYGDRIINIDVGMSPVYGENEPTALLFTAERIQLFRPSGISAIPSLVSA